MQMNVKGKKRGIAQHYSAIPPARRDGEFRRLECYLSAQETMQTYLARRGFESHSRAAARIYQLALDSTKVT